MLDPSVSTADCAIDGRFYLVGLGEIYKVAVPVGSPTVNKVSTLFPNKATRMYNLLGIVNRNMLPVPYGPVGAAIDSTPRYYLKPIV